MKKNLGKTIIGVMLGGGLLGYAIHQYRKSLSDANKAEEEDKKYFQDDLGLSDQDAKEMIREEVEENEDFVKRVFRLSTRGGDKYWIGDVYTNLDEAFTCSRVIHVTSDAANKRCDLIFQLPDYTKSTVKGAPRFGSYMTAIKNMVATPLDGIDYRVRPAGYMAISWESDGETMADVVELDPQIYANFADEERHRDGLTAFYEDAMKTGKIDEESLRVIDRFFAACFDETVKVNIDGIFLGVKVSMNTVGRDGVRFEEVSELVKNVLENPDPEKEETRYDYVVFHAPDSKGRSNMSLAYNHVDGQIVIENFC